MSEGKKRRVHTAEFNAKLGLEAVRGVKKVTEIAQEYGVHHTQGTESLAGSTLDAFDSGNQPMPQAA